MAFYLLEEIWQIADESCSWRWQFVLQTIWGIRNTKHCRASLYIWRVIGVDKQKASAWKKPQGEGLPLALNVIIK